jgi:hypothetical protein
VAAVQTSCVGAYTEALVMTNKYLAGYTDTWSFFDVLAYNFGLLYDSAMTAIQEILAPPAGTNYFMIGYSLGNMFYLIFFTA